MPKLPPKPLVSEVLDAVHKAKTKAKKIEVLQDLRDVNIAVFGGQDGEPTFL